MNFISMVKAGHSTDALKEPTDLKMSTAGVYKDLCLQQEFGGQIQLMPEDTNWMKLL